MPEATTRRECQTCHKPFTVFTKRTRDPRRGRFCSRSCASVYGGHRSVELHPQVGVQNYNFRHGDSGNASRYTRPYKVAHPERVEAHKEVQSALNHGTLTKAEACEVCGQVKRLDAHHRDYAEPLKVWWLCRACHNLVHRMAKRRRREPRTHRSGTNLRP